ncbi:MAG TPA: alanine--tRNA ligase [Gammaproteobacteria bacterium]|nr:alanine--tRNA ligase [Gammaproteobacteria bacterium]
MKSNELRQTFLDYFVKHGHTIVPSSSLVPANDPTLLFTNAGMVQFKDVFLGKESRAYTRAVSAQRCVRAGGKHNDLENVGYTARHHTFFEMLGNFSFGDYFKREAIVLAWNFLTEELKIPPSKLWVTVFKDDNEAADIWLKELKIDPARFSRCGEKDNFWSMGDTGPCGPCSEIFYDHGEEIPGGPPGSEDQEGDRYIEIWNLVFMQFNRSADGKMTPLPKPSVDTGMGLERICAVMQQVHSNYEIDIFRHLIQAIADLAEITDLTHASLRVIADHIRSVAFLIADGVTPSNEGRGYVLRRIIRRAIRHGHKLGLREAFFYRLVSPLVKEMGDAYPELTKAAPIIEKVLQHEEEQFAETLDQGMKLLERALQGLKDNIIPGEILFRLYDTYGFPPDLTGDIARERGLTLDYPGFEAAMEQQRQQSQAASQFGVDYKVELQIAGETEFTGYEQISGEGTVTALIAQGALVQKLLPGSDGAVILDRTPFYAESGGQVGDKGQLFFETGVFQVNDTQKQGLIYLHHGKVLSGTLETGAKVTAEVDASRRAIMLNHSATHLLHAALRRLLGNHVIQKGSLVEASRLRFDFSHFSPLTTSEIKEIERLVNQQIRANLPCHIDFMNANAAKNMGAMALFEEKYGDEVRVLSMGEFSVELCGGTHVSRTGDIGLFKIISETGIAAGVRRIEALTGDNALDWIDQTEANLQTMAEILKTHKEDVVVKLQQLLEQNRNLEKNLNKLKNEQIHSQIQELVSKTLKVGDISVLSTLIPTVDVETLRQLMDVLRQKLTHAVIVLATHNEARISLVAGVTKDCLDKVQANTLISFVAQQVGGKGGGRPELAQGGGDRVEQLDAALNSVVPWIRQKLQLSS